MSIIGSPIQVPQARTVSDCVLECKRANAQMYNILKTAHSHRYNAIWRDRQFTPEQIIAEFGTDAKTLFEASEAIQELLLAVDPTYVHLSVPEGYSITFNPDGTANVTKE